MPEEQKPAEKPAAKPAAAHPAPPKPPAAMAATPWDGELPRMVKEQFGDKILESSMYLGQSFFVIKPESVVSLLDFLKLEGEFDYLIDVTAADYPDRPERFDVFYILYSFARNERIRVKTRVKDGYKPESVTSVFPAADWLEREVFDMFGIEFAGHPNMKRILLPDEWEGFPLRKDYGIIQMDERWVKENLGIESGQ